MVNTIRSSMGNSIINNGSYNNYVDLNFLGNFFAFNENIYSLIAGVFEGIRRRQGLGQYESLAKANIPKDNYDSAFVFLHENIIVFSKAINRSRAGIAA